MRSCKDFTPDAFEVQDAAFLKLFGTDSTQSHVLETIRTHLAPKCSKIKSELYKMLVYGEGDFFNPHVDTQRGDNMFATLVVMLPAHCTGGELTISHENEEKEFRAPWDEIQWVAFFADCKHEVAEVCSGYRICFTFNLLRDGPDIPAAAKAQTPADKFVEKVSQTLERRGEDTYVASFLEHKYALSLLNGGGQHLKGNDVLVFPSRCCPQRLGGARCSSPAPDVWRWLR